MSLELTDTGFDFSILSEFRSRLVQKGEESILLEKMLDCFREKQLLKARGKQRTDSTHIAASVRYLSRLESVAETLRATFNEIAKTHPEWLLEQVSVKWTLQPCRLLVRLVEVCDDDCPHLIINILTTGAVIPDTSVGKEIHDSLKNKQLLPTTHLVDLGYVDTKWIMESAKQDGIRVLGPARQNYHWQVKSKTGFALADFSIDWENKQVTCPTGQIAKNWAARNYQGREKIRVRFKPSQCQRCRQKELCTRSKLRRAVMFPKREEYDVLEAARIEETTVEWQQQYNRRAGIEGTFSQAVRGYGLRRTRYRWRTENAFAQSGNRVGNQRRQKRRLVERKETRADQIIKICKTENKRTLRIRQQYPFSGRSTTEKYCNYINLNHLFN